MDPIRRTAGKKPHAAPSGDGGIVPRLFISTLGCGLSAWAHTVHGNSETRLRRLLLGTRKVALAVAPAEIRDQRDDLRVTEGDATSGNNSDGIKTTFAASSGGAAEQGTHRVNQPPSADRRHFAAAVPWFRRDAQTSSWFSHYPTRGQTGHPASLDGAGTQDRHPFAGSFCTDFETGPKRSGIGSEHAVEQRAGGGTH